MAKKKKTDDQPIDLAELTPEEILDELLFESYITTTEGPACKCYCAVLTHFHGMIPDGLCGKNLETEVEWENIPEFESTASTLCPCQLPHFYKISYTPGDPGLTYELLPDDKKKIMDNRSPKYLPNFRS